MIKEDGLHVILCPFTSIAVISGRQKVIMKGVQWNPDYRLASANFKPRLA